MSPSPYPDRYQKDDFTTHVNITHTPTGFKFYQAGPRIVVLQTGDDGIYRMFADFTNNDLLIEHTVLSEAALRKAAIIWLKGHLK